MTKAEIIELLEDAAIELEICGGKSEVIGNLDALINYISNSLVKVVVT